MFEIATKKEQKINNISRVAPFPFTLNTTEMVFSGTEKDFCQETLTKLIY